ncbi:MAG: hemerythrin family protein, partial [bacterium]|nr:hemerythrin family protein [bacterium]
GYKHYDAPKKSHALFVEKVVDFQQKQADGRLMLSMEIMSFLKNWLKDHIMGEDKKYTTCFHENGLT